MVSQGLALSVFVGGVFHSVFSALCSRTCAFLLRPRCAASRPGAAGAAGSGFQALRIPLQHRWLEPTSSQQQEHLSRLLGFPFRTGKDLTRLNKYPTGDKGRCSGSHVPIALQKKTSLTALFKGEIQIVRVPYEQGHWAICPILHIRDI